MTALTFIVPGPLEQLTGGYLFDRRIVDGLRARGRNVDVVDLAAADPAGALAALANGSPVVVDGLALPRLGDILPAAADRLRLVAFVHHSLAEETGLSAVEARRLARLEADLLPRCRGTICPSRRSAAAVAACGVPGARIAVTPPGTAKPAAPPRPRQGRVRRLLCVASVIPRKGHLVLIEALAQLVDLDWTLFCIGSLERDPVAVRAVRQAVRAANLENRVTFAGERRPAELAEAYAAADAFVLPSYHEGYGMAFAEAMAHGLPIIAARGGAVPETVPETAGLLVPPGDAARLAAAVRRLLTEPGLARRLAAGAREAGAALPDWPRAVAAWETAVDRLAALAAPAAAGDPAVNPLG